MNPTNRTNRTSRIARTTRVAAFVMAAAAGTLAALPLNAAPASAHEVYTASFSSVMPVYAVPLDSLGGRTLAQYVTEHETRVLGPTGV